MTRIRKFLLREEIDETQISHKYITSKNFYHKHSFKNTLIFHAFTWYVG